MAWIETIDESEATGDAKAQYDEIIQRRGYVPNIRKIHSIKPDLMRHYRDFSQGVTFGATSLGREREEMLAVAISALLKCKY
ncbi:MAG: peroxidase [bacterium]